MLCVPRRTVGVLLPVIIMFCVHAPFRTLLLPRALLTDVALPYTSKMILQQPYLNTHVDIRRIIAHVCSELRM